MPDLVVGCPVYRREWILERWFDHVMGACDEARLAPEFVFVANKGDERTLDVVTSRSMELRRPADIIILPETTHDGTRIWNLDRFAFMVNLRNALLQRVRQIGPQMFWSLDSDILPAPDSLRLAAEQLERFDAVGMRTFMTPGSDTSCASKALIVNGALVNRHDAKGGTFKVDAIMAAKLMTPAAYHVDYRLHPHGEDIGWSVACVEAGLRLGWCGTADAKHVMAPEFLDTLDIRVGF